MIRTILHRFGMATGVIVTLTGSLAAQSLSSIAPIMGAAGSTVGVTLTGTSFVQGQTSVSVSTGDVVVASVNVVSTTQLTASFTLNSNAAIGARYVTVNTPGGSSNPAVFTVTVPNSGQPIIVTYAGLPHIVIGAQATTQTLDSATAVIVDGFGGFYFTSGHRVYHVTTSGTLAVAAGNGIGGFSGDGGPATSAQLNSPAGLALDTSGNLYVADTGNNRVRKVAASGVITSVAGSGGPAGGFSGDGGPATSAQLYSPRGLAVDASSNLYIADSGNSRIRMLSPSGVITTVAGSGAVGFGGDGGPPVSAQLSGPVGVAVDTSGSLYIADQSNNCIRKVASGVITTVAGSCGSSLGFSGDGGPATSAILASPEGIAVDALGNFYVADTSNNRIRKVASGVITTVAGSGTGITGGFSGDGGPATSALLELPTGVVVDASGNLYIADDGNSVIRKVATSGVITTVGGNRGTAGGYSGDGGPAASAQLTGPVGVAVDASGNLYIADQSNNCIRKVASGVITTVAGSCGSSFGFSGDGGPATSAQLSGPSGVAVDTSGNLYIADTYNSVIRKVATSGVITTVAGNGTAGFSGDGGPAASAQLNGPSGVAVDTSGNLYIADRGNNVIRKVGVSGVITTVAGNGTSGFSGDGRPATSAQLNGPSGVAVDTSGNLYIADNLNHVIRKVGASGVITTIAGNGSYNGSIGDGSPATAFVLPSPNGLAIDAVGNLYIADYLLGRVRQLAPSGVITTVAGNGGPGADGDGTPAKTAQLRNPIGVAVDAAGNLYIADYYNNNIREVPSISPASGPRKRAGQLVSQ